MACVRLACEGYGLLWALLRGFGPGKAAPPDTRGPLRGHTCVRHSAGLRGARGSRRGHKRAAQVGAGDCGPPGPGALGRNGSAGSGRGAEGGAHRPGPPPSLSPRPAAERGPAEGPGAPRGPERAPSSSRWWRPGRGCSQSPREARDRRWAVRRGRVFRRRRRGEPGAEQAPQGVFQEELEWCISQLEANLHLTPHPKPEETQHIFKVLHSPETPLAEKQQVMSNEFGDCHLKMDEGQKSMEKGMTPDVVEVQPSKGQAADGVKQSDPTPEVKPELFTSSGSSFRFDFTLSKTEPEADPGDSGDEQVQNRATKQENWNGALRFAAPGQEPKFAFNFAIPDEECPHLQLLPASQHTEHTADPSLPAESAALPQAAALQKPEVTQVTGNAPEEDRSHATSKIPQTETAPADEAMTEKSTGGGAAQKKKKKKQKAPVSKNKTEETETSRKAKAEANSCQNTDTSHQDEKTSQSDEQLWKEVDWCVNQLELGLKTQKPTPKQAEEALRAIRTLRSDKAPLVKKRQLMRAMFGDYRKKMQEELCRELKLMEAAAKSARIVELTGSIHKNGQFIRKSLGACRKSQGSAESPSESHRTLNTGLFNFTTPQEFHFNFF
ncbi:N-acetylglucosamine-6-phosphate deacetylase isoform X2 [Onychostruthus taczanowskii]|uniref:N-acetylglucosamine-6-phosphate deacetylase isoform X2 n=1 Tax=Onychostruthus taczanowskii TaxID=356909 RepID=UPI001B8070CB|nr:N-acetylglucosamine-6-phosphate deacetylase isoform X2 [Onychostruthus taczanowskii]